MVRLRMFDRSARSVRRLSKMLCLARHSVAHRGVRGAGVELVGEVDRRQAVALGGEPGRRGARLEVLRLHLVQDRGRERVAQPDQEIACLNAAAFADEDLLDDAALQVLHRLDVAVDADNARRDHRALDRGEQGPGGNAAGKGRDDREAGEDRTPAERRAGGLGRFQGAVGGGARLMAPASGRGPAASAAAGGCRHATNFAEVERAEAER